MGGAKQPGTWEHVGKNTRELGAEKLISSREGQKKEFSEQSKNSEGSREIAKII